MTEVWKDSPSAPGYQVSNLGRARRSKPDGHRAKAGFILKLNYDSAGYAYIRASVCGKVSHLRISRAVCEAFHGPPFAGAEAAHGNGNCKDNRAENLRWATPLENAADRIRHGTTNRGERNAQAKLTAGQVQAIRQKKHYFGVCRDLAAQYGVSASYISSIRRGKSWPEFRGSRSEHVGRGSIPLLAKSLRANNPSAGEGRGDEDTGEPSE